MKANAPDFQDGDSGPQVEISCEFQDLFGEVPEVLRPFMVSFRHALVDFAN